MKLSKIALFVLLSIASISCAFASPTSALDCFSNVPAEVKAANGCDGSNTNAVPDILTNILNSIILISGLIAVIFIIIGGVKYMTSTGDAGKIKHAKDTILYAVIGLVICVLAFIIVNWTISVLNKAEETSGQSIVVRDLATKSLHF